MKTLNAYATSELMKLARMNFHTIKRVLNEKGIKPVMTRMHGAKEHNYYGDEAYIVAHEIFEKKEAALQAKRDKAAIRAARMQMGLPVGRGHKLALPTILDEGPTPQLEQQELPLAEVVGASGIVGEEKIDTTVANNVVSQLSRIADAMERMAAAWEARPNCKE